MKAGQSSSSSRSSEPTKVGAELTHRMEMAFAPLHKRAFGTAVGLVFGLALFLVTSVAVIRGGDYPAVLNRIPFLVPTYSLTWTGAVLGSLSVAFGLFCAGWFLAFSRNLVLAMSIWVLRTRAELSQTQDFLDHI